eukprot:TRINITY_DN57161_c0_g1_i1.p1 TRINITY_DN57161_c0_g1~~TRINITY_DN57161_c0_g1_i1.p1  ORF type:complete len:227 (-),score=25.63 TRINITY_DN57161_c0_g1_i1:163-843(-)
MHCSGKVHIRGTRSWPPMWVAVITGLATSAGVAADTSLMASVREHCTEGLLALSRRDGPGAAVAYGDAVEELTSNEPDAGTGTDDAALYYSVLADVSLELARAHSIMRNATGMLANARRAQMLYADGSAYPPDFTQDVCGPPEYPNGRLAFSSDIVSYTLQHEHYAPSEILADAQAAYDMASQKRGVDDEMVQQMENTLRMVRKRVEMLQRRSAIEHQTRVEEVYP